MKRTCWKWVVTGGVLLLAACARDTTQSNTSEDCAGGKCDEADGAPLIECLRDHSGRDQSSIALGDPLAKLVFADGECEMGFADTVSALTASGKCRNHRTMGVSEIAQRIDDKPPFFRSVTALDCDVGEDDAGNKLVAGVWFSMFVDPEAADAGSFGTAEMISFDPVEGIFNYYETSQGAIEFFGNSMDFILDERPPSAAAQSSTARCAGCHRGGGLIMKELPAPWMHWEPDFVTPGHDELIENNEELMGRPSNGIDLETTIVRPTNRTWNRSRFAKVFAGLGTTTNLQLLLRPLFCTEDINLASNFDESVSSGQLGGGTVVDARLSSFTSVPIARSEYDAIKEHFDQRMDERHLSDFDDTVGALARVFRGATDSDYEDLLLGAPFTNAAGIAATVKVVDPEFVEDVLLVDFTRAIQHEGDDRCDLLRFAPELRPEQVTPDAVREGFIRKLQEDGDSAAARDFLSYLKNDDDDAAATVRRFEIACNNRTDSKEAAGKQVSGIAFDYLSYVFHNRNVAADLPLFEFDGATMPITDAFPAGTRLDPNTCLLTDEYVSPAVVSSSDPQPPRGGGPEGPETNSCSDRCGLFVEEASCQCDVECFEADDCCDDFRTLCPDVTGTLSCTSRCGDDDPGLGCSCAFDCDGDGDCCADWAAECMDPANLDPGPAPNPKLSCDGRCNVFDASANCQCTEICLELETCCPDFSLHCG